MQFTIEPDLPPRQTAFHKRITHIHPIPNTRAGNDLILECGHRVQSFGDLRHAEGRVFCTQCRDKAVTNAEG